MQTNTLTAPRPMMHDIMPPYAKSLPKKFAPVVAIAADIPVAQPTDPQAGLNPVDPAPPQAPAPMPPPTETAPVPQPQPSQSPVTAPAPEQHHERSMPPIRRPGISWAAMVLAILVAVVLGAAAVMAFKATNS